MKDVAWGFIIIKLDHKKIKIMLQLRMNSQINLYCHNKKLYFLRRVGKGIQKSIWTQA